MVYLLPGIPDTKQKKKKKNYSAIVTRCFGAHFTRRALGIDYVDGV